MKLPVIQCIFIPDPGCTMLEVDLQGADAQIVAWEAQDARLKELFRAGEDVHAHNAADLEPGFARLDPSDPKRKQLRYEFKRFVHATNYGGKPRTIARTNGWTVHETERFQQRWFSAHPGILNWHQQVRASLMSTRSVSNAFGYKITFYDRIDSVLPEALAWIPQSSVAITCFRGALALRRFAPEAQLLLQNHDSLVLQVPSPLRSETLNKIKGLLHIPVPYPDALTIPWSLKTSTKSWGDCTPQEWPRAPTERSP